MRQMLTIAMLHLKLSFASKGTLTVMFLMPLMLTMIFGAMLAGAGDSSGAKGYMYPVAVVDQDGSFASKALVEALQAQPNLRVRIAAEAEMNRLFTDRVIDSGVIIPKGFQQGITAGTAPEVQLVAAPGGNVFVGVRPTLMNQVLIVSQNYRLALEATPDKLDSAVQAAFRKLAEDRTTIAATVAAESLTKNVAPTAWNKKTAMSRLTVGFTVTFVMMIVFLLSGVILQERKRGTWARLLITPASRATLLTGYLLSFFLTGMAQFAILVGATTLLFGVYWGPLLPLTAMAAATVLCAAGMGLFIAGLVRSPEQQVTIGVLLVNATSMLGGVYWDLSFVSDTMRRIGYLTPQAWALDGFTDVILRGGSFEGLAMPLAVLLGIAAVFTTAGLLRVRYE